MKQSTKLLSLVLALVMAFSCMAVIGNASLVYSDTHWDNIDDAQLTAEQVADLALDMVDNDLLSGIEPINIVVADINLSSVNNAISSIVDLRANLLWSLAALAVGNVGDLTFKPLTTNNKEGFLSGADPYQRVSGNTIVDGNPASASGNIDVVMALLNFIGCEQNADILSRAAYGLSGGSGVNLGLINSFLDLGEVGDMLNNIPGMLTELVYDLLVHGSYADPDRQQTKYGKTYEDNSYPSVEDLGGSGATLPGDVNSLDKIVGNAITALLVYPQNYEWEGEGDDAVKVWDTKTLPLPTVAKYGYDTVYEYFSVIGQNVDTSSAVSENDKDGTAQMNSLFQLIDKVAPFAIYDMGVSALNNNLKKALMELVDVELDEIKEAALPAEIKTDFEVAAEDGQESYVTYIAYDKLTASGNDWYYTTMESQTIVDPVTKEPVLDDEGNEQSERVRKFYKANTAGANDFFYLVDWDWAFYAPEPLTGDATIDDLQELNYEALIANYGSITESLNQILYIVFETAIKEEVKNDFAEKTSDYWLGDAVGESNYPTSAIVEDEMGNETSVFMYNVTRILKYLLAEHADKMFGSDSPYVAWEYEDVADKTIGELIAIIGPVFFEDVMPQLIMPKNPDGTYAFHKGTEVLEFGALVIREFITEIAPNVNYDSYIFAEGTVTSANDRKFKQQDAEAWFNIILNMGLDIGYTYLNNITNFNTAIPAQGITEDRWMDMLDDAIMWAANYAGSGKTSIIHGFEPDTIESKTGPLNKLSYILNTLLPLGFINGCTSATYDFDISILFDKAKDLLTTFDLTNLVSLFGRNTASSYNFMDDANIVTAVVRIVNNILNLVLPISENGSGQTTLLQASEDAKTRISADAIVSQANLKITVYNLLRALPTQGRDLLNCALPVLGMFIEGWGTEQEFNPPQVSLSRSIDLTNGATSGAVTVNVRNGSNGVWRHYIDGNDQPQTDEQYKIILKSVNAYDGISDNASATVTTSMSEQTVDYGRSGSFTYTASGVGTAGDLVRFEIGYQVVDEDGELMANKKIFYVKSYAWLNYNGTNEGSETVYKENDDAKSYTYMYSPYYVGLSNAPAEIAELTPITLKRENAYLTNAANAGAQATTATIDGITFGSVDYTLQNASDGLSISISSFKTYSESITYKYKSGVLNRENSTTLNLQVKGGVNEAAWKAANKTPGSDTTFKVKLKSKDAWSGENDLVIKYYDDVYYNKLAQLASSEMSAMRLAADYNLTGTFYTGGILNAANSEDADGETIFRDTNFTTTKWIANEDAGKWAGSYTAADGSTITETVTTYEENQVSDITTEEDADGNVTAKYGTVGEGEDKISVRLVTVIDCATAVNSYVAAFEPGVRGGMQAWNDNSVYNHKALYEALYVTANDIGYCKKSTEQVIREGNGDNIDAAVETLKGVVDTAEATYSDGKDYTDYKMYRWNRYNDARDDAKWYIQLQNDASNATVDEIDESFPYTWIEEDDLRTLVKGDKYEAYIIALLEPLDEEEKEAKAEWLEAKKLEYDSQSLLDVEMATNLLERVAPRLIARDHGVITKYLDDEITSANNMVGAESEYTARSWAKYEAAMTEALKVQANPTQMTVFDAKYELMTARNELVLVDEEADYSELEALIAQAQMVMANTGLYNNTNKEIGQVLAELGYETLTNADGDEVQLFPGSALYYNAEPYARDEQDEIDEAARSLKEALAKLKFKGLSITGANVTTETIVPADEENGIEAVTAEVARINALQDADAVKALFKTTATNASATDVTVSGDDHYTVDMDLEYFAGTASTVTFYTTVSGTKIPVATIKLVVDGDIDGDGVVDALDATLAEKAAYDRVDLSGLYFIAANLDTATEEIEVADYSAVVDKALA